MIENFVPAPSQKAVAASEGEPAQQPAPAESTADMTLDKFDQGIYGHVSGTILATLPENEVVDRLVALVASSDDPDSWPKQVPPAMRQKVIDKLVDQIACGEVPDATLEAPWRLVGQQLVAGLVSRIADNKIDETWPQYVPEAMVDQVLAGLVERIEAGNVGKSWSYSVPQWVIDRVVAGLIERIQSHNIPETWVQAFPAKDDPLKPAAVDPAQPLKDDKAQKLVKDVYRRLWAAAEHSSDLLTLQRLYRALQKLATEPGRSILLLPNPPATQMCTSEASKRPAPAVASPGNGAGAQDASQAGKGENDDGAHGASGDADHKPGAGQVADPNLRFCQYALFETGLDTWQKDVLIDCLDVDPGIFTDEIDEQICQINTPKTTDKDYASIYKLAAMPSLEALRRLVGLWAKWIAINRRDLMQVAGEAMRKNPYAVLPLVEQLDKGFEPATKQEEDAIYELNRLVFKDYDAYRLQLRSQAADVPDDALVGEAEFNQVLAKLEEVAGETIVRDLQDQCRRESWPEKKYYERLRAGAGSLIHAARLKALRDASIRVTQYAARQLADMSDARFYASKEHTIGDAVRNELKRHAQPILAQRVSDVNETDIRRRESYTRLLANLGGREAGDALVRAVLGEERTRAGRQDLLSTYYLVPSLKRGEEAAALLKQAADEARRSLRLLQGLNVAVFVVGLAVLVVGLWIAFTSSSGSRQVAGALAAIGGLGGVITQLVRDPLDRIQDAMTNLVQLETAFTSFIWELNLNGTYVQSQYVNDGKLDNQTIAETVARIEQAMGTAMSQAALYTESASRGLPPLITRVLPVTAGPEQEFTVYGNRLRPADGGGKGSAGLVAINHVPVRADVSRWDDRSVVFKLTDGLAGLEARAGTAWVSLFVGGAESNALPFHVLPLAAPPTPPVIQKPADGDQLKAALGLRPAEPAGAQEQAPTP